MELTILIVLVIISSKDFTKTLISSFPLTVVLLISLLAVNKSPFEISCAAKLTLRSGLNFLVKNHISAPITIANKITLIIIVRGRMPPRTLGRIIDFAGIDIHP